MEFEAPYLKNSQNIYEILKLLFFEKISEILWKINNYNFKLTEVKNIELIETHFVPDKIRTYIEKNITLKYTILYNFKNAKF